MAKTIIVRTQKEEDYRNTNRRQAKIFIAIWKYFLVWALPLGLITMAGTTRTIGIIWLAIWILYIIFRKK